MTKKKRIIISAVIGVLIIAGALAFAIATGNKDEAAESEVYELVTDESGNSYWVDENGNPVDESELPPEIFSTDPDTSADNGNNGKNNYAPGEAEYEFDLANGDEDAAKPDNSGSASSEKNYESATFAPPSDGTLKEADAKAAADELLSLTDFTEFGYSADVSAGNFKFKSATLDNGVFNDRTEQVWSVFYENKDDGSEFFFELDQTTGKLLRFGTY